jgi:hypothetical protein
MFVLLDVLARVAVLSFLCEGGTLMNQVESKYFHIRVFFDFEFVLSHVLGMCYDAHATCSVDHCETDLNLKGKPSNIFRFDAICIHAELKREFFG